MICRERECVCVYSWILLAYWGRSKVLSATVHFALLYSARAYLQTIVMGTGGLKLGRDSYRGVLIRDKNRN